MKSTKDVSGSLKPPSYPLINTLNKFERNEALKQLASKISEVCSSSGSSNELMAFQLEELPNILQLLAELAIEAKASDTNREEKNKILHVAAAMLRRMLHMPEASHYRVLGLDNEANFAQIAEHYRLLHELFWFDGTIDPQQKSRLRIFEAYTILKDSESRDRYDKDLLGFEQQDSRSGRSSLWRAAAVVLPVIFGLSAVMFYLDKSPGTEVASSLPKEKSDVYVTSAESSKPEKSSVASVPAAAQPSLEPNGQQSPLSESLPSYSFSELIIDANSGEVFLPEKVPEVVEVISTRNSELNSRRITKTQIDNNLQLITPLQEPPVDIVYSEAPHTIRPEVVYPEVEEFVHVEPIEKHRSSITSPDSEPENVVSITEAQVDTELLMPNLLPKPSLLSVAPTEIPQPERVKAVPARVKASVPQVMQTEQQLLSTIPTGNSAPRLPADTESTIVVIGSPNLSLSRLTKEQVEKLFLGKMAMLPRWQGIEIFDQQDGNKIKRNFYNAITKKALMQIKADWIKLQFRGLSNQGLIRPPVVLMNDQAIKERVAASKSAIGYISRASLDSSVKVLLSLK